MSLVEFQSTVELGENDLRKFTVGIYYRWHLPFGLWYNLIHFCPFF